MSAERAAISYGFRPISPSLLTSRYDRSPYTGGEATILNDTYCPGSGTVRRYTVRARCNIASLKKVIYK